MLTIYKKFGEKVRELRKGENLSQEQLAEKIKRDPRTVVAIEGGKRNPTLHTISKLAKALGIGIRDLF